MYHLTLIKCRKCNWLHTGSFPVIPTTNHLNNIMAKIVLKTEISFESNEVRNAKDACYLMQAALGQFPFSNAPHVTVTVREVKSDDKVIL